MNNINSRVTVIFIFAAALNLAILAGCSKDTNPLEEKESDHDHAEAAGFVVMAGDEELVKYEQGVVTGSFSVTVNQQTPVLKIQFIAEDGDLFSPEGDAYAFAWEIANTGIAAMIYAEADGKWQFKLQGVSQGVTTIILKINHNDHADFVGLPVTITVQNPVISVY